ncbi:hypothetical protein J2Y67_000071 [Neobacillus niacini]|nr:hypothetical protein [Neobacillus niacini]
MSPFNILEMRKSIEIDREKMLKLAKRKGMGNFEVLQISQDIDKKIFLLQRFQVEKVSTNNSVYAN